MNPLASQEPPNGDFVAYIERLQRESLARHASGQPHPANAPQSLTSAADEPSSPGGAPVLSAEQARELIAKLGSGDFQFAQVIPFAAIALGVLSLVTTLISNQGPFGFFIGVGLIIWGARRLESLKKKSAS
ncbi:MAG: hypothetical protein RR101_08270 [Burkholderiaceae bacterium]